MQGHRAVLLRAFILDCERLFQLFEKFGGRQAVQVLHHAVVVDDAELVGREGHREEITILLTTRMARIIGAALLSHTRSGGRAVMSVGNIERRNARKNLRNAVVGLLVADHPQLVSEAVVGREIILRSVVFHHVGDNGVDLGIVGISEEHRFDIGFLVAHVDHAVLLLVGTRQFVLLDGARKVILEMAAHRKAVLRAAVHRLRIYIIVLFGVLAEPAFGLPFAEILNRFVVNGLRMLVGDRLEVDLGFDDVQQRTLRGLGFRLDGVEHIVRARSHLGSVLLRGTDCAERFDTYHIVIVLSKKGGRFRTRLLS